jgi:hypothetical protein
LQRRGQEGVVDDGFRPGLARLCGDLANIHDPHEGIAWALDQNQPRGTRDGGRHCGVVTEIDEGDFELPPGLACGQQAPGARVAIVRGDDEIAGLEAL